MRDLRIFKTALFACVIVVASLLAADRTPARAEATSARPVLIEFTEPMHALEAADLLETSGGAILELRHRYRAGSRDWSGGLVLGGRVGGRQIADRYAAHHEASITDQLETLKGLEASGVTEGLQVVRESLEAARGALTGDVVWAAKAMVTVEQRDALSRDSRVRTVRDQAAKKSGGRAGLAAPALSHVSRSQWVPDDVYVTVTNSSTPGQRYAQQVFRWNSGRSLSFGSAGGYEADFFLAAFSWTPGTYITTAEQWWNPGRIPDVYWSTDLPGSNPYAPYLDSRIGDPTGEYSYTVGTPSGHLITTGYWYNTYIRGSNGSASSDRGKITPQLTQCTDWASGCNTFTQVAHDTCPPGDWPISIPVSSYYWNRFSNGCT